MMCSIVRTTCFVVTLIACLKLITAQTPPANVTGEMLKQRTKLFTDSKDHISFHYPATYEMNDAAAPRFPKGATARSLICLTDKDTGAKITVIIDPVVFKLDYIRQGAPTGMEDPDWLLFTEFGPNKFYYYTGGNSAFQHPDAYYYDLNGKILTFGFDGPYAEGSVLPDSMEAGAIEEIVLGSLKTPESHVSRIPASGIIYGNEQHGFQLTLAQAWTGYKVTETSDTSDGSTHLVFSVPAKNAPNGLPLLSLDVQSRNVWNQRVRRCGCGTNLVSNGAHAIGRTRTTVFSVERWGHGLPDDQAEETKYQIDQVVESFKLLR
jgi:hypothetical protein